MVANRVKRSQVWLKVLWCVLLMVCSATTMRVRAEGTFIAATGRVDMVYDGPRDVLYISAGDSVLRYQTATGAFLSPFVLGGNLGGIDLSPDGNLLAVADRSQTETTNRIHIVDLTKGQARQVSFTKEFGEAGTWSVAFGSDGALLISSHFNGSGTVPLRRYDPASNSTTLLTSGLSNLNQDTMLSANADRSVIAFAESNSSDGPWGRYRVADGDLARRQGYTDGTSAFNYEIGVNRNGTQFAIPTYFGAYIYNASYQKIATVGDYAGVHPIGVAYHPTQDLVYFAMAQTRSVRAYNTSDFSLAATYDFENTFESPGNHAFVEGRLRIAPDGSKLFCTVDNGVRMLTLAAAPPTPTPTPEPTPTPTPEPTPTVEPTPTPIPDTLAPEVVIQTPSPGSAVTALSSVRGLASDDTGVAKVLLQLQRGLDKRFWNGRSWVTNAATFEANLYGSDVRRRIFGRTLGLPRGASLPESIYLLTARAVDAAGNEGVAKSSFSVDKTAPTLQILEPFDGASRASLNFVFNGKALDNRTGSGVAKVLLTLRRRSDGAYFNGQSWGRTIATFPARLSRGAWLFSSAALRDGAAASSLYDLSVAAFDRAGNRTVRTARFAVDTSAPSIIIDTPALNASLNSLVEIAGRHADAEKFPPPFNRANIDVFLIRESDGKYWFRGQWYAQTRAAIDFAPLPQAQVPRGQWRFSSTRAHPLPSGASLQPGRYRVLAVIYDSALNFNRAVSTFNVTESISVARSFDMLMTPLRAVG